MQNHLFTIRYCCNITNGSDQYFWTCVASFVCFRHKAIANKQWISLQNGQSFKHFAINFAIKLKSCNLWRYVILKHARKKTYLFAMDVVRWGTGIKTSFFVLKRIQFVWYNYNCIQVVRHSEIAALKNKLKHHLKTSSKFYKTTMIM